MMAVQAAHKAMADAVNGFNEAMEEAWNDVETAIHTYESACEDAESFREKVHADMENYFNIRSDAWQTTEEGQLFSEWLDDWDAAFTDPTMPEKPSAVAVGREELEDELRSLQEEIGHPKLLSQQGP
jgi:hypothetical protein